MQYSVVINLLLLLIVLTNAYRDNLPHMALEQVPAKLGAPVEIRCVKIIEKTRTSTYAPSGSNFRSASCSNWRGTFCKYEWSRNGVILSPGDEYQIENSITLDYCETFKKTTDVVTKMHFPIADADAKNRDRSMKCFASALTIRNVTLNDLGDYKCKLVSSEDEKIGNPPLSDDIATIKVINSASSVRLPKKIDYFENSYPERIRSKLLMQCVVSGGPVHWFVRFASKECSQYDDNHLDSGSNCINETIQPIESIGKMDSWRCFNFTVSSHQPYGIDQVTESFVYVEKMCSKDWAGLYCSVDSDGKVRSKVRNIEFSNRQSSGSSWSSWEQEHSLWVMILIMLPIIVPVFFIAGGVFACTRAKSCNCCGGQNLSSPHAFALVNHQQI